MAAKPVDDLPQGEEWLYEVKWDGYRVLALKEGSKVRLLSRKNNDLSKDYPMVVDAIASLPADVALLDGEVVSLDKEGRPSFQGLQNRASVGRGHTVVYYAFDLLNLEGRNLQALPLEDRKANLASLLEGSKVRFSANL